jgi:hypothetical protein
MKRTHPPEKSLITLLWVFYGILYGVEWLDGMMNDD